MDDKNGILKADSQEGILYHYQKRYRAAIRSSLSSLKLAEEIGDREELLSIYENLYKSYDSLDNTREAYRYLNLYSTERDSVFNREKTHEISELEIKYQTSEKEAQIAKQQLEIEKTTRQRNQYLAVGGLVALFALSTFIILNLRLRKNRQLTRQNQVIQEQKIRELEKEKKLLSMASMIDGQEAERMRIAKDGICKK